MAQLENDILARLHSAIENWRDEILAAQDGLTRQIEGASVQLDTLSEVLAASTGAATVTARIEALNRELESRDETLAEATRRAADLEQSLDDLYDEMTRLRPLEARNEALSNELEELRRDAEAKGAELEQRQARIREIEQALAAASQPAEQNVSTSALNKELARLEDEKAEAVERAVQLQAELERARAKARTAGTELEAAQREIERLKRSLADHFTSAPGQTPASVPPDKKVGELENEINRLTSELETAVSARESLREQLEELRSGDGAGGNDTLEEAHAEIASLEMLLEQHRRRGDEDAERIAKLQNAVIKLQSNFDSLRRQTKTAESGAVEHIAALEAQNASNQAMLEDARAQIDGLKQRVADTEQAMQDLRARNGVLRETLAERERADLASTQHIVQLGETVTRLESELEQLGGGDVKSTRQLEEELEALRSERDWQAQTLEEARWEIDSLNEALAASGKGGAGAGDKDNMAQALVRKTELENEVRGLKDRLGELEETNRRLQQEVDDHARMEEVRTRQNRIALVALDADRRPRMMGSILLAAGVITEEQLEEALGDQLDMPDKLLGAILLEKGYVDEHDIAQVIASQLQIPFMPLGEETVSPEAAGLLDSKFCVMHMCVPLRATPDLLVVAMANPLDGDALEKIESGTTRRVMPVVATPSDVSSVVENIFGGY